MPELSCAACVELCPEVALGAADAEDRAEVLAHVERCAACAVSLRAMTDVGDGLVGLVPPVDPPSGFERRVLGAIREHLASEDRSMRWERLRSKPLAVAASIVVAAVFALGGWLVGATTSAPATASVVTATLVSQHKPAGEVVLVPGAHQWLSMTVHLGYGDEAVWCQVRDGQRRFVTLGSFSVADGYGSWASPLPDGITVSGARLITRDGRVLASASLSTS